MTTQAECSKFCEKHILGNVTDLVEFSIRMSFEDEMA